MAEGFQLELLEDNRVGLRFNELWAAASRELKWVVDLSDHVYERLASVSTQGCASELKDRVIKAAHTSYHFVWRRVLHPASLLPWRLCRGNVQANIKELLALKDPPEDPVSSNLWHLGKDNYPKLQLQQVVELLAECPWSSMPAEQQHASVALLHRWHQEYGAEQLLSRALLHQVVRLLPRPSKLDRQITRVIAKYHKTQAKNPLRASGSHMLVQALVRVFKGKKELQLIFTLEG